MKFEDILQTDAAINPAPGGPLNTHGERHTRFSPKPKASASDPAKRVAALLSTWFTPEKRARLGSACVSRAKTVRSSSPRSGQSGGQGGLKCTPSSWRWMVNAMAMSSIFNGT
jgi:hypothetical protein